jgi:hypothetical protein
MYYRILILCNYGGFSLLRNLTCFVGQIDGQFEQDLTQKASCARIWPQKIYPYKHQAKPVHYLCRSIVCGHIIVWRTLPINSILEFSKS